MTAPTTPPPAVTTQPAGGAKPSQSRKRRGADTQRIAAAYLREHGFPHAEAVGAGAAGRDVTGCIGVAWEVKARRDWNPLAWLRQARRNAGADLPAVIARPDGMGPESVADWPVVMRLEDAARLLTDAGYSDDRESRLLTGRLGQLRARLDDIEADRPRPSIEESIERSSLGSPEAKALRASVPAEVAREIVRRAGELT